MKNYNLSMLEEGFIEESEEQKVYCNYQLYIQLTNLNYNEDQIAQQLYCSVEYIQKLKAMFE